MPQDWKDMLPSDIGSLTSDLPNHKKKFQMCAGEFFGTAMILYFGCLSCTTAVPENILSISFAFGLTVMSAVVIFGHISGGHFNPAVTIAAIIYGKLPLLMGPLYILSQYLGALIGFAFLKFTVPPVFMKADSTGICTALLNPKVLPIQGLIIEFMVTGALILMVCAVWDERNSNKEDSVAIKFGLFIVMVAIGAAPLTSAALNPARAFAPAYLNNDWRDHWIYVAGPLAAGVVFSLVYQLLFRETQHEPILTNIKREDRYQVPIELTSNISDPKATI